MENLVKLTDVTFGYGEKVVLDNISLSINQGDYVGIIGPNGSAKSTLVKLMLRILKTKRGSIELFGTDINYFKDWGKIGYVAQKATSFNTSFPATVEEVVAANLYPKIGLFKSIKKAHMERVYEALKFVGMEDYRDRLIGNLSGGQQQRVFIARTLVSSPKIIFLDEPTVGIDIKSQREFYKLLNKLNEEMNITIVMVSHDIGVVTERANKILIMGDGKLYECSDCSSTSLNMALEEVYGENMKVLNHHHH